ncbi:MAG: hypothetical protein DCF22_17085, partial [Leptolyngbya sp.]
LGNAISFYLTLLTHHLIIGKPLDYWVIDVTERKLHVFRSPNQDGYESETVLREDATISPLQFPNAIVIVRDLLPKVRPSL